MQELNLASNALASPITNDTFRPTIPDYDPIVQRLLALVQQLPTSVSRPEAAEIIRATMHNMLDAGVENATNDRFARVMITTQANQAQQLEHARRYLAEIALYQDRIRLLESAVFTCQNQANELSELLDTFLLTSAPDGLNETEVIACA